MYRDTIRKSDMTKFKETKFDTLNGPNSKINRICDAFLQVLKNKTATNLQNTITAHVCKNPADLDGGLLIIADLLSM